MPELLAIGAFVILPWIGITVALDYVHDRQKAAAMQSTAGLAQALEEGTRRTIGEIDSILLGARAMNLVQGEKFDLRQWTGTQTLPDKMTAQIGMTDRAGLVTASTRTLTPGVSVADREHFRAQLDPARDDLFISKPVIGRTSGRETIQFSRKLLDPGGSFAGIIVLSLDAVELARFYQSLRLGRGFVEILATDGTVLARGPRTGSLAAAHMRRTTGPESLLAAGTGTIELPADSERGAQIASFQHVPDYPLIVLVAFDKETVFAPYRSLRNGALPAGVAITLAVGLVGLLWVRQKRRSLASRIALQVTLETVSQGILMLDAKGDVLVTNSRLREMLGDPGDEPDNAIAQIASRADALAAGQDATQDEFRPDGCSSVAEAGSDHPGRTGDHGHRAVPLRWQDNKFEATLETGMIIEVRTHALPDGGCVQTYTDVTQQRQSHAEVVHLAHHDGLTGLANRVALMEHLSAITGRNPQREEPSALLMIDLDGFKGVNDTLGHDAGDLLLIEVGVRLRSLVRGADVVARLGGDEFVILLPSVRQVDDVPPLAQRVLQRLADPMEINGQQCRIGASLGIAFHPVDGMDADTWLKHADVALYSAKNGGRGIYRCFDQQLSVAVKEHRQLEGELRQALDSEELEVYFQPKFDCNSLQITGFEALARWPHPTRGLISPTVFVGIAEDCGLIVRIGELILQQTCRRIAGWKVRYPVAVNVSVMQLCDSGLKDYIAEVLEQTGLRPEHLEIEVTESVMAEDGAVVLGNLQAIKAMGISVALDDFGTGYSSLSHLQRFMFDKIKIDRSFVQGQADNPTVWVILKSILGMCSDLGLATVGEGIETDEQLAVLRDLGCSEVQGYLLGRPMPHDQVQDFIRSHTASLSGPVAADTNRVDIASLS